MRTFLTLVTVTAIGIAGAAYATDRAENNATDRVITANQMKAIIAKLGYDVDHLKKDDGVYRTRIIDRDSGGKVVAHFDGKTGELVRARLAHSEHEVDEHDETDERHNAGAQKSGALMGRGDRENRYEKRD
jgi:hypothetical protein